MTIMPKGPKALSHCWGQAHHPGVDVGPIQVIVAASREAGQAALLC